MDNKEGDDYNDDNNDDYNDDNDNNNEENNEDNEQWPFQPNPQVIYWKKGQTNGTVIDISPQGLIYQSDHRPIPPIIPPQPTTLILIASYRDGERCGRTILDAFTNAENPHRVNIAVVDQVGPGDKSCVYWYCHKIRRRKRLLRQRRRMRRRLLEEDATRRMLKEKKKKDKNNKKKKNKQKQKEKRKNDQTRSHKKDDNIKESTTCDRLEQIRNITLDWTESFGPAHARSYGLSLIHNHTSFDKHTHSSTSSSTSSSPDDFCLQVDGHSRFTPSWDTHLLSSWNSTANEYAILTTYVHDTTNINNDLYTPHVCTSEWGSWGVIRNGQSSISQYLPKPKLNWAWCAGMSYMKCHGELKVPNDPNLKQVFDGEEFSRGLRLWTHGYDMYTPDGNFVYHDYDKVMMMESGSGEKKKQVWNMEPPPVSEEVLEEQRKRSEKRLHALMGTVESGDDKEEGEGEDLGIYGLGTVRTLDQYYNFSGIDPRGPEESRVKADGQSCGDLPWIPWNGNALDEAKKSRDEQMQKMMMNSPIEDVVVLPYPVNMNLYPSATHMRLLNGVVVAFFLLFMGALRYYPTRKRYQEALSTQK